MAGGAGQARRGVVYHAVSSIIANTNLSSKLTLLQLSGLLLLLIIMMMMRS